VSICFAFDNEHSQDGAGAQVFRIIGVFCLARHYKIGFVNRDILTLDSNPGDNMDSHQKELELIADLGKFLNLDSYSCKLHHEEKVLPDHLFFRLQIFFLMWLRFRQLLNLVKGTHEVYTVQNPYKLTLKKPNVYKYFRDTRPLQNNKKLHDKFDVQLHIRRAYVSNSRFQNRFSPTEWYREILSPITTLLKANHIPYEITVHTDVSHPNADWKPSFSTATSDYFKNNDVKFNEDSTISLGYEDFSETLGDLGNINVVTGISVLEAWEMMQHADLLIIGKSTFSFVPGLLNQRGTIISPVGFLEGPRTWTFLNEPPKMTTMLVKTILDKWTGSSNK